VHRVCAVHCTCAVHHVCAVHFICGALWSCSAPSLCDVRAVQCTCGCSDSVSVQRAVSGKQQARQEGSGAMKSAVQAAGDRLWVCCSKGNAQGRRALEIAVERQHVHSAAKCRRAVRHHSTESMVTARLCTHTHTHMHTHAGDSILPHQPRCCLTALLQGRASSPGGSKC